jgi:hypothetical protein
MEASIALRRGRGEVAEREEVGGRISDRDALIESQEMSQRRAQVTNYEGLEEVDG